MANYNPCQMRSIYFHPHICLGLSSLPSTSSLVLLPRGVNFLTVESLTLLCSFQLPQLPFLAKMLKTPLCYEMWVRSECTYEDGPLCHV